MSTIEKKIAGLLQKYDVLLGFLAISIIAFQLRWHLYPHETADYSFFMKSWIAQLMEHPGLSGIGQNIGEYNVPYMLFLAIVGRTSFNDLYEIKNLSVLFDFLGSAAAVLLLSKIKGTKLLTPQNLLAYSVLLLVPNTFLNSAFWGQCDFIYVTFLLLCTYFLVKENYPAAMIFYGIALAFKLQAIFFLPVLLIYYFASRKVNILHFLWIPLVFFIMDLPAIIAGRGLSDTLNIYRSQTDIYKQLTMNCPNLFVFMPGDYDLFSKLGIWTAFAIFMVSAVVIARQGIRDNKQLVLLALWSAMVCIYFLPAMHERYVFICCIFSILWAFLYRKDWWIAVGINFVTLLSSANYLFKVDIMEMKYLALANLVLLGAITIRLFFQYPAVAPVPATTPVTESAPEVKPEGNRKSVKKHT